ncbi:MAG: hypothetical protein LLF81_01220 [Porphyromonadaceae bacterium]|nr:hypothetical protein [Porphyromonadaceae bacterium]
MRALTFCRLLRLFMFSEPTPEDICWNWKKFLRPIKMWSGLLQRFQRIIPSGYITQWVSPLLNNECDMVLGYSTVKILSQEVNPLKILTGERALLKEDIAPLLDKMKESRFGVETLLYFFYISLGKTLKFLRLAEMKHNDKYKKMTALKATTSYINEGWEIASTAIKNYDLLLKATERQIKKGVKL